jgi:hypothetical protein
VIAQLFAGFSQTLWDVTLAFLPLVVFYLLFNFFYWKLPRRQVLQFFRGILVAFIGLTLFMQGVNVGFNSMGEAIGNTLGGVSFNWILIPIGFVLGFVVTMAEPAIQVLNMEVEKVTGGYIHNKVMLYFLSIGVAVAVALSMLRILLGVSLWYFIIPGYLAIFFLAPKVPPLFVGLAFDSGGVVTGPMIATFLLAFTVGSSQAVPGSNPLFDGFGMISLVAMVPILSILILGFLYSRSEAKGKEGGKDAIRQRA